MKRVLLGLVLAALGVLVYSIIEVAATEARVTSDVGASSTGAERHDPEASSPGRVVVDAVGRPRSSKVVGDHAARVLRVVSSESGHGLGGAVVTVRWLEGRSGRVASSAAEFEKNWSDRPENASPAVAGDVPKPLLIRADSEGRANVPIPRVHHASVPARITVRCPGYVGVRVMDVVPPTGTAIELEPAGSVRVRVSDALGVPRAGVAVGLLPPVVAGTAFRGSFGADLSPAFPAAAPLPGWEVGMRGWRMARGVFDYAGRRIDRRVIGAPAGSWHGTTDSAGRTEFPDLPAGVGYRFVLLDPLPSTLVPSHENVFLASLAEHVQVGTPPVPGMSGEFEVIAGECAEGTVVATVCSSIRGQIEARRPTIAPQVKLYRVSRARAKSGKTVTSLDMVDLVVADTQGRFAFAGVPVGEYVVRAWWQVGESHVYFAAIGALLESAHGVDVGRFGSHRGSQITVAIELRDDQRRVLEPKRWAPPTQQYAFLVVEVLPDSFDAGDAIYEVITLAFRKRYVLHGLRPGRLQLRTAAPQWPRNPDVARAGGDFELQMFHQPTRMERVGASTVAQLDLSIRVLRRTPVRIVYPSGVEHTAVEAWVLREGGVAQRVRLNGLSDANEGDRMASIAWPVDAKRLHLRNGMTGPGTGFCGSAEIDSASREVTVRLREAVAIHGWVRNAAGKPRDGVVLQWTMPGWRAGPTDEFPVRARTDRSGYFRVSGLIPGANLVPQRKPWTLPPGSAGQELEVNLLDNR